MNITPFMDPEPGRPTYRRGVNVSASYFTGVGRLVRVQGDWPCRYCIPDFQVLYSNLASSICEGQRQGQRLITRPVGLVSSSLRMWCICLSIVHRIPLGFGDLRKVVFHKPCFSNILPSRE
jgi:hypothetical protein